MGFRRYQQVRIESGGRLRELPPALATTCRATYREADDAQAVVTIAQPAPSTVSALRADGAVVEVVAGYIEDGPPPGSVVRGRVLLGSVRERWGPGSHVVEAVVRPSDVRTSPTVRARAWQSTTGREVWDHVVTSSGMALGRPPPTAGASYRGGYAVRGAPGPILRRVAADAGWRWAVSGGVVDVWGDVGEAPLIAPDTGLIGSAERLDDGRIGIRCQLRADVRPGGIVAVRSRALGDAAVQVRVVEVDVDADSQGGPFELRIVGEVQR